MFLTVASPEGPHLYHVTAEPGVCFEFFRYPGLGVADGPGRAHVLSGDAIPGLPGVDQLYMPQPPPDNLAVGGACAVTFQKDDRLYAASGRRVLDQDGWVKLLLVGSWSQGV